VSHATGIAPRVAVGFADIGLVTQTKTRPAETVEEAREVTHSMDGGVAAVATVTEAFGTVREHVAFDPVRHTHAYEGAPEFHLQAYSVEEIAAEKLRAIYQRGAARDYYDLYSELRRARCRALHAFWRRQTLHARP
jgi:predicted nucleotidyltransferase component of viral defense system